MIIKKKRDWGLVIAIILLSSVYAHLSERGLGLIDWIKRIEN